MTKDDDMQFDVTAVQAATGANAAIGRLAVARDAMNAAYNAMAAAPNLELARGYVREAREAVRAVTGTEARDDAAAAARAVLPRIDHATQLLDGLGVNPDPVHVAPLLDELGLAMDHIEQALAAVGWE